jgi:hypothetical protein
MCNFRSTMLISKLVNNTRQYHNIPKRLDQQDVEKKEIRKQQQHFCNDTMIMKIEHE